jgi:hypothetical protein
MIFTPFAHREMIKAVPNAIGDEYTDEEKRIRLRVVRDLLSGGRFQIYGEGNVTLASIKLPTPSGDVLEIDGAQAIRFILGTATITETGTAKGARMVSAAGLTVATKLSVGYKSSDVVLNSLRFRKDGKLTVGEAIVFHQQ